MPDTLESRIRAVVRDVPDFPRPGVIFKDITPLLADTVLFARAVRAMAEPFAGAGVTHVAAVESRGFIFGAPVALALTAGFIPVRKAGKLPWATRAVEYALEYGSGRIEIHLDSCPAGARVLLVDDVLATGGTAAAACTLLEGLGGHVVGCSFLIALSFLPGAAALGARKATAIVTY